MNWSRFRQPRYLYVNGIGFEMLGHTSVPKRRPSTPTPHPEPRYSFKVKDIAFLLIHDRRVSKKSSMEYCKCQQFIFYSHKEMSRNMTKPAEWPVRPTKNQIPPVWSESSLRAQWVAKDPRFLHECGQLRTHGFFMCTPKTGQMHRLIWVFAGRTGQFVNFIMLRLRQRYQTLIASRPKSKVGSFYASRLDSFITSLAKVLIDLYVDAEKLVTSNEPRVTNHSNLSIGIVG